MHGNRALPVASAADDRPAEPAPAAGQLWISVPPHKVLARVLSVDARAESPVVEYQLLDDDGAPLSRRLSVELDASWWTTFRRLRGMPVTPSFGGYQPVR